MINELKWQTLTGAVNEIKSSNQFLKKLLFSREEPKHTEDIEFSVINRGREIAPFIRKNGEAIMVTGYTSKNHVVSAPNIRIKMPFTPSELLFGRRPGTVVYITADNQSQAIQDHINRDLEGMEAMIVNAEEWLCAQAITGTITYSVADQEVFQITFPRPAGNNVTPSVFWDDATPADVTFEADINAIKKIMSDEVGLAPTDAIMGAAAAAALRSLISGGYIKTLNNQWNVSGGEASFVEQYSDDGVIYIGRINGIRFWEYSRAANLNGVSTAMIRTKYIEFVSTSAASDRVMYYGAIPDMDALEGKLFQGKRFSKSWRIPDPSSQMSLVHSRPLPVTRRPGATVSFQAAT